MRSLNDIQYFWFDMMMRRTFWAFSDKVIGCFVEAGVVDGMWICCSIPVALPMFDSVLMISTIDWNWFLDFLGVLSIIRLVIRVVAKFFVPSPLPGMSRLVLHVPQCWYMDLIYISFPWPSLYIPNRLPSLWRAYWVGFRCSWGLIGEWLETKCCLRSMAPCKLGRTGVLTVLCLYHFCLGWICFRLGNWNAPHPLCKICRSRLMKFIFTPLTIYSTHSK